MTWLEHHRLSEQYAAEAEIANQRGELTQAQNFYAKAAQAEERALQEVAPDKPRTYGITAVSAVALYFKASELSASQALAYRCLASQRLPEFALQQMEDLLEQVYFQRHLNSKGVALADDEIQLSLSGQDAEPVEIHGVLRYADATRDNSNQIRVIDNEDNRTHTIEVPEGMMNNIVRPMWDLDVVIVGLRIGNRIVLRDIWEADAD